MDEKGFFPAMVIAVIGVVGIVAILGIFNGPIGSSRNAGGESIAFLEDMPPEGGGGDGGYIPPSSGREAGRGDGSYTNTGCGCTAGSTMCASAKQLNTCVISNVTGCGEWVYSKSSYGDCYSGCTYQPTPTCNKQCTLGSSFCSGSNVVQCVTSGACDTVWQTTRSCTFGCEVVYNASSSGAACRTGPTTCADSDGGVAYAVTGTVSGSNSYGDPYSMSDSCFSSYDLVEYYCQSGSPVSTYYRCPSSGTTGNGSGTVSCSAGRCI
jgi:hypothetical protein